jgi:hypothetical protein
MEIPQYIARLHQASGNGKARDRRAWGLEVGATWLPYFIATNAVGLSHLAPETLGAPMRLRLKDGEVQFTKDGRPSLTIAKELGAEVAHVKANFEATLLQFVNEVQQESPDAYKAQVEASQKAGEPIMADMQRQISEAVAALQPKPTQESAPTPVEFSQPPTPEESALPKRRSREPLAA